VWLAGAGGLVALAVWLRAIGLGDRPLFRDEAASWLESRYPLPELLHHASGEPYPPLYALVLHAWMPWFGDSAASLRAPSVLAGIGVLVVGWRWAHEGLGRWAGLVALAVLAVSPLAIANARDARMYALEALFATVAWWLIWRLLTRPPAVADRRSRWIHGVALAAAVAGELWTLSLGLVVAALQCLLVVAVLWRARSRPPERTGATVALAGGIAGGLTFLPWLPLALAAAASGERYWTSTPRPLEWLLSLHVQVVGWSETSRATLASGVMLGVAAVGVGWLVASRDRARRLLAWCVIGGMALIGVVWAISLVRSVYDHRYFGAATAPIAIAVAAGALAVASALVGRLPRADRGPRVPSRPGDDPRARMLVVAAAAAVAAIGGDFAGEMVTNLRRPTQVAPVRAVLEHALAHTRTGDVLLAADARAYFPLAYEAELAGRAGRAVPPVLDWRPPDEPRYHGASLISDAVSLDEHAVGAHGLRTAARLGPAGRIWLVAAGEDAHLDPKFAPMHDGRATVVERFVIRNAPDEPAQVVLLEVPG
jgi:4-amino-4-deoxy-L-arabinose transferase-like glycosyltransferase